MTLEAYKENLELFSLRLPFESDEFMATFIEFNNWYIKQKYNSKAIELLSKYKMILLYTLKIKCKLIPNNLSKLIPNKIDEFNLIVSEKKAYLLNIYQSGVLLKEEYNDILFTMNEDKQEIINQVILNRLMLVNINPSFQSIKDTIFFTEFIKSKVGDIDIEYIYQWRKTMKLKVIKKWFTKMLC
jgi:hypothetical protein